MSLFDWLKPHDQPTNNPSQSTTTDGLHDELHKTIVAYGVSNRQLSSDGKTFADGRWSAPIDKATHYFKQTVELTGADGNFHAASTSQPEVISKADFDKGVADQVHAANGKLGIYTHGIRTAAGEAGENAAELSADTGKPFVTEDWASTKATGLLSVAHQEKSDDQASFHSQPMIDASVAELTQTYGAANIDMVAHSRGSMNQIRALASLQSKDLGSVHSATFAHSDVDVSDFEFALPSFRKAADHVNVIYNPSDDALRLAEIQRFGQVAVFSNNSGIEESERLGRVGLSATDARGNYYQASKTPNYFSMAKDQQNDFVGHAFAPNLVASMISNPTNYQSFSTLARPTELQKTDCPISPISKLEHVFSAAPRLALRVMAPARQLYDIVSASPEVQSFVDHTQVTDTYAFAGLYPEV
jgi:esterase/lipase superfamily enzyme